MPTFDLNQVLSKPQLYTPIDYGNLNISTDSVHKAMNGIKDTIHALGYKTKEEKQKEFEDKIKAMQERTAGLSDADSATD